MQPPLQGPLADALEAHAQTLHQCEALTRIVLHLGQCPPDEQSRRACRQLLDYFDALVGEQQAQEERELYPVLVESVPGSDAVCLREMTLGLAHEHRTIAALWRRLREEVAAIAAGGSPPSVVTDADAFSRLTRAHTEREALELLPMLMRLAAPAYGLSPQCRASPATSRSA